MASYKLFYFPVTALGEPIRMTFALGGVAFEDARTGGAEWGEMKKQAKYAGQQMPILEVKTEKGEELMLRQSRSILRFLGKICSYEGKPLYPTDPLEAYRCDELIDFMEDVRPFVVPTFAIADQAEKEKARADLVRAPDGKAYVKFKELNDKLAGRPFAAGDAPSIADAYIVTMAYMFSAPSFLDGFPDDALKDFPNIVDLKNRFCSLPPLAAHYAGAEAFRAPFAQTS